MKPSQHLQPKTNLRWLQSLEEPTEAKEEEGVKEVIEEDEVGEASHQQQPLSLEGQDTLQCLPKVVVIAIIGMATKLFSVFHH